MALDVPALVAGLKRIAARMEARADALNTADGRLGDGDLGITMVRGSRLVMEVVDDLPDDLGVALMKVAQAFTKTSGSSYGTLLATGLMSAAKSLRGQRQVPVDRVPRLVEDAKQAMMARGRASLGDKTVLDALDSAARDMAGQADGAAMVAAAQGAVRATMEEFRDKPCRIGRARIFGDKSIGLDDPGMLAFAEMLAALQVPNGDRQPQIG